MGLVFGVTPYNLLAKRALFLAIITFLAGGLIMFLELGQPLRMINVLLSPNPSSPMWWIAVFYISYLILLLVVFYLSGSLLLLLAPIVFLVTVSCRPLIYYCSDHFYV